MRPDWIARSWWRTRRAMSMSASTLAHRREEQWARLQPALARTPALAGFQGRALADYPITDPAKLRADYGHWNSLGMSDTQLRALANTAEAGKATKELSAGWSTGSGGGARGLFVATPYERADYLGQSLARLLPFSELLRRQRLALHLRASNALYSDVAGRRFSFAHFPLAASPSSTIARLECFAPTILIAPTYRLLAFVKAGLRLPTLRHLFCGSEPITPAEHTHIAEAFGLQPRSIYQATEGFLAAECKHGRLHLNEHALDVEFEPVKSTNGFRPVVTDLHRTSQPVVRLRLDDYIELDEGACPCGYTARTILPPQGRVTDIWRFDDRTVTPPQVVAAVEGELGGDHAWQAIARYDTITLRCAAETPSALAQMGARALHDLAGKPVSHKCDLGSWQGPKRRKIVWDHG